MAISLLCFFLLLFASFSVNSETNDHSCVKYIKEMTQHKVLLTLLGVSYDEVQSQVNALSKQIVTKENVSIVLYDKNNKTKILTDCDAPLSLKFNETKVIIHGWTDTAYKKWIKTIAWNYHQTGNFNVFAIDWSSFSKQDYVSAVGAAQAVGYVIGDFFIKACENKTGCFDNFHIIGHSLGGQVSSFVSKRIFQKTHLKVDRVSGLDVAAPLFEFPSKRGPECRLDVTDANYVDLMHTQVVFRGVLKSYGTVDFYVNGGYSQLKCDEKLPSLTATVSCGHQAAHYYYANSILHPTLYKALACDRYLNYIAGFCFRNNVNYMGDAVNRNATGTYYVKVDEVNIKT